MMNQPDANPYLGPQARIADAPSVMDVPDTITTPIRHGWIAATVSCVMTLVVTLIALSSGTDSALFSAWSLIDVGLIALLAFGIHRKSRTAATLMLLYFVLSKILIMYETRAPSGLIVGLVLIIFYFRAMTATFRYHRFVKAWKLNPPPSRPRLSDDPLFAARESPATQTLDSNQ